VEWIGTAQVLEYIRRQVIGRLSRIQQPWSYTCVKHARRGPFRLNCITSPTVSHDGLVQMSRRTNETYLAVKTGAATIVMKIMSAHNITSQIYITNISQSFSQAHHSISRQWAPTSRNSGCSCTHTNGLSGCGAPRRARPRLEAIFYKVTKSLFCL